jgi:DNA-cytosine methyltransferase
MDTAATLFSGGGGADVGLSAAGLDVKWGLEHDEEIAQVARDNGLNIHTADVTKVDPKWYERVDVLHASPPCPNFSVAKTGGEETDEDVSLARATVRFVEAIEPSLFTLENVWGYRKSQSWRLIREHLQQNGYDWNGWHLNCANWGVPQTRKRMIVAARKGGPRPKRPTATHAKEPPTGGLFGDTLDEWVGWYEAIEDLIPTLPETELADWQKERLPNELCETTMAPVQGADSTDFPGKNPSQTVPVKGHSTGNWSAIICDTQPNARGENREDGEPTKSVDATHAANRRAVLVGTNSIDGDAPPQRPEDQPTLTQRPNDEGRLWAVLVHGQQTNPAPSGKREDRTAITKEDGKPVFSVNATAYKGTGRAVLINESSTLEQREAAEPAASQVATERNRHQRAVMERRVVQMTPRALARFQTFPDGYDLPDTKSLACRIIGNAVPPLAMKKWVQAWV